MESFEAFTAGSFVVVSKGVITTPAGGKGILNVVSGVDVAGWRPEVCSHHAERWTFLS